MNQFQSIDPMMKSWLYVDNFLWKNIKRPSNLHIFSYISDSFIWLLSDHNLKHFEYPLLVVHIWIYLPIIKWRFSASSNRYESANVTRFGEISLLWQFFNGLFLIWQNTVPTLANLWHIGLISIVANDQILKNNISI